MRHIWLVCAALTGCAAPSIALQLEMPVDNVAGFDMSCLTSVDVMGFSQQMLAEAPADIGLHMDQFHESPTCVAVKNVTTFADLEDQLRDQIDLALPLGGLAAIEIRGRAGLCDGNPFGEGLIYGGGNFIPGASFVSVAIEPDINCTAATQLRIQPIDMLGMIADPAHACTLLVDNSNDLEFPAVIRPSELSTKPTGEDVTVFESGADGESLGDDGTALLGTYKAAEPGSCIAVARGSDDLQGAACVNASVPSLCAKAATTIELPVVNMSKFVAIGDDALIDQYSTPIAGFAWSITSGVKAPLANATVTPSDPAHTKVLYLDLVNGVPQVTELAKTNATGMFLVYAVGVTTVTVSDGVHQPETITVAPATEMGVGTTLAVLQ